MKNGQHMPYEAQPMIFHKIITYFALPVGIVYYIYRTVESFKAFGADDLVFMFDALPFIVLIALYLCAEIALLKRSKNGVRLLISSNIFGAVSNYAIYLMYAITQKSSGLQPDTSIFFGNVLRPIVYALIFFLYYRKRRAFFGDVQTCLNCGRKVKDTEPKCPFCGLAWNVLAQSDAPSPDVPSQPIASPPVSQVRVPQDQEKKHNPAASAALGILLALIAFGALYWFVFMSGFVANRPAPQSSPSSALVDKAAVKPSSTPRATPAPTPMPTPTPAPNYAYLDDGADFTPLRVGDSGVPVESVQRALIATGYLDGAADGYYGPNTQQAILDFQKKYLPGEPEYATTRTIAYLMLGPGKDEFQNIFDPDAYPKGDPTVYFAPFSGRFYHRNRDCWALEGSLQVAESSLDYALEQNLKPCTTCGDEVEPEPTFNPNQWTAMRG